MKQYCQHSEDYVKAVDVGITTGYHYVYNYTDHFNRLSYGRDPDTEEVAILKESHY